MSKQKRKHTSAQSTRLLRWGYYILDLVQSPFDWLFWLIEKPKARIWQRLRDDVGVDQ
jgi:hypothetical protein